MNEANQGFNFAPLGRRTALLAASRRIGGRLTLRWAAKEVLIKLMKTLSYTWWCQDGKLL